MSTDIIKSDGRYLHGEDLRIGNKWTAFDLEVESVGEKDSARTEQGKVIKGWPVSFKGRAKTLVLNDTNTKLAKAAMQSSSRAEWVGQKLTVYPAMLAECFGQTNIVCVRVRVPAGLPRPFIMPKHMGKDLTQDG